MSGPQKQKLADVTTVTPTLNDKTVTIQTGKVRTSLYSAIYDLFKAKFDDLYATLNMLATKQDKFNASNTATGSTSVTINAKSGVARFTQRIPYGEAVDLNITNSLVTNSSIIVFSLKSNSTGCPTISKYATSVGTIGVRILNAVDGGGEQTDDDLIVAFQILN
jgi:hypothetical protein